MRRSHLGLASLASIASVFALLAACGGTSDVTIPPAGGSGADGATPEGGSVPPSEGGAPKDASTTPDGADPPKDAGVVVHEEPSPDCHDLKQIGPLVMPTFSAGDPPVPAPIASIPPGLYVAKEITYYGMVSSFSPQRITAYFTGSREYYIAGGAGAQSTVYTLDYKISNSSISRDITCPTNSPSVPDAKLGAATNGFVIYVPGNTSGSNGASQTVRYELSN